jgi:DNA-binding NarL/FixJ family response regulator
MNHLRTVPNRRFDSGPPASIGPLSDISGADPSDAASQKGQTTIIVDRRSLSRECLARALMAAAPDTAVLTFATVQEWLQASSKPISASLLVLCTGSRSIRDADTSREIALLTQAGNMPPTAVLSDEEDPNQIIAALDCGVRGYMPTSLPLEVAIEALGIVRAGGTYVPASSLLSYRKALDGFSHPAMPAGGEAFTNRQMAVLKALREGKANKVIAFELNMQESTVKVHIRAIMKKLRARNRTEVAFKTNELFASEQRSRMI